MIKRVCLFLLLCSSMSLFSQEFNRSHFNSLMQWGGPILATDSGTYYLYSDADEGYKLLRYNEQGSVINRTNYEIDSLRLQPYGLLSQSDSTLIVYGNISGKTSSSTDDMLFVAKYTTDLSMLKIVLLPDSASVMYSHHLFHNADLLLVRTNGFYILDKNLNVVEDRSTITNNAFGVRLSRDSILLQTSSGFRLWNSNSGLSNTNQLVTSIGSAVTQDYSDSSLSVYDGQQMLYTFRKDGLTALDTVDLSVAGFSPRIVRVFENYLVGFSKDGDYSVFDKQNFQLVASGSLLSRQSSGSFLSRFVSMNDSLLGFTTHVSHCQQTHIEVFNFKGTPAPAFDSVVLNPQLLQARVVGGAEPSGLSAFAYKYKSTVDIDLWIKNTSSDFLDSVTIVYGSYIGAERCEGLRRLAIPGVNLAAGDSAKINIVDSFDVYTNVLNTATLKMNFIPVVANGQIIGGSGSDTLVQTFTGLSTVEPKLSSKFSLFPSPASEKITIVSQSGEPVEQLAIYSVTGELLVKNNSEEAEVRVPLQKLPSGLYVITVRIGSDTSSRIFRKD